MRTRVAAGSLKAASDSVRPTLQITCKGDCCGRFIWIRAATFGRSSLRKTWPGPTVNMANRKHFISQRSPADEFRVSKKTHAEMIHPQFDFRDFGGCSVSWCLLGCRIVRIAQHELIAPGGSNPGFQCYSAVSPSRKCGFVIMTNADSGLNLLTELTPTVLGGS